MSKLEQAYEKLVDAEERYDEAIWGYLDIVENLPWAVKINKLDEIDEALDKITKRIEIKKSQLSGEKPT